ncbi:trypsin-like peptidase domain-containing protein [Streptomyces sp. NPDC056244]|uniref:VMAP-C domain-containing protein n=1 Tax=Streptomyces sp. NPDC056244 TaxID=3345762 RepID=UPI0035DE8785
MSWFRSAAPSATADPRYCVVSVLRSRGGKAAGAGVLLAPGTLLTCAHVVNDALGRGPFDSRAPGHATVSIAVHDPVGTSGYEGRTVYWVPPRRLDGSPGVREGVDQEWLGDLAVVRFDPEPGGSPEPPQWRPMAEGQSLRAWHSTGLRSSFADVTVGSCDEVFGYVDGLPTGMAIGPAYSGGPLWAAAHNAVVGIVAAHIMPPADPVTGRPRPYSSQHLARRSWCIPWQRVESELRAVGAGRLFDGAGAATDDPALLLLTELIEQFMPSTLRAERAVSLARLCGLGYRDDGSAPGPEEFARLLVTEPRALATLTEALRHEARAVRQLLAAGRLSSVPHLLSHREHRNLHSLLGAVPGPVMARLPEAVRAALPLAAAFPAEADPDTGGGGLLDHLERLPGDSRTEQTGPRVPGLLRVVEYLAALCSPAQRAGLRLWSDGVAQRLGIPRSALRERRSDAEEWIQTLTERSAPPRVLVHVTRGAGNRFRLRVWCDEGAGPRQVSTDGDVTYSGSEAAQELLRVLESFYRAAPDDRRPLVEALVDRAGLNLPIDEWESFGPEDVVPGVIGAEYPLVVNCPELLRRNERFLPDWRRRWRQLDTGMSLRFSDEAAGPREIYGALMDRMDAVRVAVDVPPRLRDEIVQVCLAVGVPVVVWDRGAGPRSHAVDHISEVTTRQLPEGVRSYRAKTLRRPADYPGRPVLAWADADRTVPQLLLSEPREN